MKRLISRFVLPLMLISGSFHLFAEPHDIYLVIYTTKSGYTGHVGIAVDNYKLVVRDTIVSGLRTARYDSVKTRTLTYFDLWGPADIRIDEHSEDLPARYFTLPRSSAEEPITPDYFLTKGLPHSYDYPCDALIRIQTTPATDFRLKQICEQVRNERPHFNSRKYNCTDFVITCLNRLFGLKLKAVEWIPFSWSSTPNKFYRVVVSSLEAQILKEPGAEINESFFKERVVNTVLYNQFINHEKNN